MSIVAQAKSVQNRADFVNFVSSLLQDLHDHPDSWENIELSRYLEALGRWVEDMDGYYRNRGDPVPTQLSWTVLADMLIAASVYE